MQFYPIIHLSLVRQFVLYNVSTQCLIYVQMHENTSSYTAFIYFDIPFIAFMAYNALYYNTTVHMDSVGDFLRSVIYEN